MPTFTDRHYVPILKGKAGEFTALGSLAGDVRENLTPLVEIVSVPWDYDVETVSKTIEAHLDTAVTQLESGWGTGELFMDSIWLDPDDQAGGKHHLEYLFDQARGRLMAIPTGGLDRSAGHVAAVGAVAAADRRGACLRLDPNDIEDPAALQTAVDGWLATTGLAPAEVDLVLDLGEITASAQQLVLLAARGSIPTLPYLTDWRTFTVAAGAFPEGLSNVAADSEDLFQRLDWALWLALHTGTLPRQPAFGDYAVTHPSLLEGNPRHMRPPVNIRYTADNLWLVVKRQWIRRGFSQFAAASKILIARSEYAGAGHCSGCEFIDACAAGGSSGNLTTWRRVGTTHHLTLATEQIASLP